MRIHKKHQVKGKHEKHFFSFIEGDIKNDKVIEGMIIRPLIQMIAFVSFILAMFLLLIGNLKWGGSLIIFSFVFNLFSLYQSLTDERSIFRTLNIGFKLVLFLAEIIAFNYALMFL